MKRLRAFLRDLLPPRDATPATPSPPAAKGPGPTPAKAVVAESNCPPWMVFQNRTPGYKEEEGLWMGRHSILEHAADVLRSFDAATDCPDRHQMSLIFQVVELAAGERWPLDSMTREQSFAALRRGLERVAQEDGRTVTRLLLEDVHAILGESERAFASGDARLGHERLVRTQAELDRALGDVGLAP